MRMLLRRVTSSRLFSFAAVVACCNFVTGSDKIMFDTDNKKLVEMIFLYLFCVLVYLRFWWMFAFIVFDVVFQY